MYNDLLKGYKSDEYVFLIEGCLNDYVSYEPASDEVCEVCGDFDWPICEGLVRDIRKAKDVDDLYDIQHKERQKTKFKRIEIKKRK